MYYRYYVNTSYFPFAQLFFYVCMFAIGFSFVVVVNLGNNRPNPFMSSNGTYKDIKWTMVYAFAFFLASGIVVLKQREDLDSYCHKDHIANNHHLERGLQGSPMINHEAAKMLEMPLH